jgi:hypothetical protein
LDRDSFLDSKHVPLYTHLYLNFWSLTPLSAIFQLYHGDQFERWRKPEYPERTTDPGHATGKLYHLRLRVECTLFCNLQSWARTHAVLVMTSPDEITTEIKMMCPNCSFKTWMKKNSFINKYPAKLLVFWEKIIHAQLLNVADDGFSYL